MLVGRESLSRLVGKRKRTLASPAAASLLHNIEKLEPDCHALNDGDVGGRESSKRHEFSSVFGSNSPKNSHLDICLSSVRKRKTCQQTLLQFNFFAKQSKKPCSSGSQIPNKHAEECETAVDEEGKISGYFVSEMLFDRSSEVTTCSSESEIYPPNNGMMHDYHPNESNDENMREFTSSPTLGAEGSEVLSRPDANVLPKDKVWKGEKCVAGYDEEVIVLDTYIVGHRFYNFADLWPGACVSVSREPENIVDQHAIKVVYALSGREQTIGYLPRQLARCLSPLIDNFGLKVEGFVTSLPTHAHDVFRIDLVCQQTMTYCEMDTENIQIFQSLWENSIHIAESEKFLPNRTKYQQNFRLMINEVRGQYHQLLTDEEKRLLDSFGALSDDSQRLFIRLYSRKAAGYVSLFQNDQNLDRSDLKEVICTLTVLELREILRMMLLKKGPRNRNKDDLIDILCTSYDGGICPSLPGAVSEMAGNCVRISSIADSLLWRVQRLFFLNGEQDLSSFLLADLGLVKYPTYTCNISLPIFHSRNDFIAYEEAIEVAQIIDESLEKNNVDIVNRCIELAEAYLLRGYEAENQKQYLYHFSASWVYAKVITLGVSFLESEKRYEDAVKLLKSLLQNCRHDRKRGYWALRLSVDLEHLGLAHESLSVAEEAILDPLVRAGSRLALQKRVLRLGKPPRRWKVPAFSSVIRRKLPEVHIEGRPLNCKTGAKNRYYGYNGEQCGVEQLALQYYAAEGGGWRGVHTESGIWLTIFGLIMWDILFTDIPDAFCTRFQTAPLDLESDNFYSSRRDLIESHLQKIQDGMAEEILIISWECHRSTACRGVNWDRHELSDLRAAVSCIGGRSLAAICRLLATDYKTWSSGMPDLLLWRFHEGVNGGEAKLVEVKGPRDKLSEQQLAWMLFLLDSGVNAEICWVRPTIKAI
ncbi:zinc ion binding/nucleic acid binding/hydrolase isoform X2 [Wolffia australiana]